MGMGGGGSGGGGGQAAQQNQYSNISPWAQPYVSSLLGAAQSQIFETRPTAAVPGTPDIQRQIGTDESGQPIYETIKGDPGRPAGTEITGIRPYTAYGMEGAGMSPAAQQAARESVAGFTPLQEQSFTGASQLQTPEQYRQATESAQQGIGQALTAGQRYQEQATNPYSVASYMNPYIQQALAPQLQLLAQQTGIQGAQQQSAATQAGAFGGSRSALQNALVQQAGNLAAQQAIGQGYNQAFQNAQQAMQYGAGLGLQGAQSGISGGTALANIGAGQLAAQQGILGLQNQYGGQQQQRAQNIINQAMQNYTTAQQYPMSQLGQLSALAAPYVTKDVTTTQQAPAPSPLASLAGVGTAGIAGLGLYNAMNK